MNNLLAKSHSTTEKQTEVNVNNYMAFYYTFTQNNYTHMSKIIQQIRQFLVEYYFFLHLIDLKNCLFKLP